MVEKTENGMLVIKGRVDSINAQAFEEELMEFCKPGEEVLIVAHGLIERSRVNGFISDAFDISPAMNCTLF